MAKTSRAEAAIRERLNEIEGDIASRAVQLDNLQREKAMLEGLLEEAGNGSEGEGESGEEMDHA